MAFRLVPKHDISDYVTFVSGLPKPFKSFYYPSEARQGTSHGLFFVSGNGYNGYVEGTSLVNGTEYFLTITYPIDNPS